MIEIPPAIAEPVGGLGAAPLGDGGGKDALFVQQVGPSRVELDDEGFAGFGQAEKLVGIGGHGASQKDIGRFRAWHAGFAAA